MIKKNENIGGFRKIGEKGPQRAHRLEGKVENRGIKAVRKKGKR